MGCCLNLNLDYGRSPKGKRVYGENPTAPGERISTVAVLTEKGVGAESLYVGTLTAERFVIYLEVYLLEILAGGKTLLMDNSPVHHAKRVKAFLSKHQVRHLFLPPYSPELNPIEEAWSKIKHYVRKQKPRTAETLCQTIKAAVATVTENDVIGYVNHAYEYL